MDESSQEPSISKTDAKKFVWDQSHFKINLESMKVREAALLGAHFKLSNPTIWGSAAVTSREAGELEQQISDLRKEIREKTKSMEAHQQSAVQFERSANDLRTNLVALQQKEELAFLLSRVSVKAQDRLLKDEAFRKSFFESKECRAFVISVDIRRSTELMLKARSATQFSEFITELCERFDEIIKGNHGVFDKFTGDGILAFFPDFFSGPDAGYHALLAAQQCQEAFKSIYKSYRTSFSTVINDVGLGIGVDYGLVNLLKMGGGLTVVGGPVVYACRLGGAPAGHIYLNQPAFEQVSGAYGGAFYCAETSLEIKHEGSILCYDIQLSRVNFTPRSPDWLSRPISSDGVLPEGATAAQATKAD